MPQKDVILVVGGCGGLGWHVVKQAIEESFDVAVLDVRTDVNKVDGAKYYEGSLTSEERVLQVLKETRATVLVNTASPRMIHQKQDNSVFDQVNVGGTKNLLECARKSGTVKAFVYTSSSSIVHDNYTSLDRVTEDTTSYCFFPEQKEYYTHSKAVAEKTVLEQNKLGGMMTTAIRAATLIGEADTLAIPSMITNAKTGRLKFQIGDGKNLFDFTYTGNAAYAHILAIKALLREHNAPDSVPDDMKVNGEAFFVTNDEPWPFWEVSRAVAAAAGYPIKDEDIWVIPPTAYYGAAVFLQSATKLFTFGQKTAFVDPKMVRYLTMTRTFDISKIKKRLGYKPREDIKEAIRRGVEWNQTHNPKLRNQS